jgi:hypothetical protein
MYNELFTSHVGHEVMHFSFKLTKNSDKRDKVKVYDNLRKLIATF